MCIKNFVDLLRIWRTDYSKCQVKQETKGEMEYVLKRKIWSAI